MFSILQSSEGYSTNSILGTVLQVLQHAAIRQTIAKTPL